MKKLIVITLCLFCYLSASSQDYLKEATACFEKGDYECAKRNYTLFQTMDGKDMSEQIKLVEECLRVRTVADGYFEDGEYERARDRYKLVLEKNPQDPIAIKRFDECLQRLGGERSVATLPVTSSSNSVLEKLFQNMILVEGGTFMMGDSDAIDADPVHHVTVNGFMIGKYEVTQKEWQTVMGNNPSHFKGDDLPVEIVSWNDVQEFLIKLNRLSGKEYRLPTEAEWEFAARGGNSSKGYQYAGSDDVGEVAWYNVGKIYPVGLKKANELGLYDMSGNVLEWCSDWYGKLGEAAVTNPIGPIKGSYRVLRGGGCIIDAVYCRPAFRYYFPPDTRSGVVGFRLAVSL